MVVEWRREGLRRVYIPPSFRVDDVAVLYEFVEEYSFATLVTVCGGVPFATHLPMLLDREHGVILGHLARANPHWEAFGGGAESAAIFHGPHAYISPAWYAAAPAVPTWNYAAVHVYGIPRLLTEDRTWEVVDQTVKKFETTRAAPWQNELPEDFRQKMLRGIVAFEMPIARIEGKFKLGQNRSEADQAGMVAHLRAGDSEAQILAEFIMRHHGSSGGV
jgi:transcriptional regulator